MRRLKDAPSEAKCQKIAEILDQDHDGSLDLGDLEMVSDRIVNRLTMVTSAIITCTNVSVTIRGFCDSSIYSLENRETEHNL